MPTTVTSPDSRQGLRRRGYRRDVQGLRGVAILVVVVLHAGLPLSGGFTGVDIFFVISGFVITGALMRRLAVDGRMQMSRFYLARIRRLLPALALMLTVVLLASTVLGAIGAMGITARTGAAAALINANTYLLLFDVGGYFDASSALNPLLHTWSLSVEEQFYVVFPTILLLSWLGLRRARYGRPQFRVRWMLIAGLTVSLGLALTLSVVVPDSASGTLPGRFNYYSAFTRGWEFAAGALLAVTPLAFTRGRRGAAWVAGAGAALIAAGLLVIAEGTTYPNVLTLLPVLGAVLVIAAGSAGEQSPVSRVLSTEPMVWVGNLSYSWYLWHWPFIVFAGIWFAGATLPRLLAAVMSLGAAWASMRFLEGPIRFRRDPTRRATLILAAVCVTLPLFSAGLLEYWHSTLKGDVSINPYALHLDSLRDCDSPAPLGKKPRDCTWPVTSAKGRAVLVGDSLAGQYSEGFVTGMNAAGFDAQIATLSACPFMEFAGSPSGAADVGFAPDKACASFERRSMAELLRNPPEIVVLSSSAQRFLTPRQIPPSPAEEARLADMRAQWTQARSAMIRRLQAAGSSVVLIEPLPKFDGWGPMTEGPFKEAPAITVLRGGSRYDPSIPRAEAAARLSIPTAAEIGATTATGSEHMQFFDRVCPGALCSARTSGAWTYRDFEHLSVDTSRSLAPAFTDLAHRVLAVRTS